jgi:hypothetical protein
MTSPAQIAAHLESARKMQATRPDVARLYRELAENEMDALRAYPNTQATESEGNA